MMNLFSQGVNILVKDRNNYNNGAQQNWGSNQSGYGNQNQGWQSQPHGSLGLGVVSEMSRLTSGNSQEGWGWVEEQSKRNEYSLLSQQQMNLNQLIAQQIIFIEPSPVHKKLQQLKAMGKPFVDDMFPANHSSLFGEYGYDKEWEGIEWKPISKVFKKPVIFDGKPKPTDIQQGYLGDCYFLAGLAALAERPDRIFNLFFFHQMNEQKYFSVKMLYKGKWMTIDIDEFIPWSEEEPAFSKSRKGELWVVLLEKAWAKLYTSYKRIEAGYPEEPIHDLTGAPFREIVFESEDFDQEKQWEYLVESSKKQYSMVCSSQGGDDTEESQVGIVQGHAYTVLNATTLMVNGEEERVVQLRNPWGDGEFTGRFSDFDEVWQEISREEKKRIGYKPNKQDGIFWMSFQQFMYQFHSITVAEIHDDASYVYKSCVDKQCKGTYFAVDILKQDDYAFMLDKTPDRIYPQKYQQTYCFPDAELQIGKLQGNSIKKWQAVRDGARTTQKKQRLSPGRYIIYAVIEFDADYEDQYEVNLAVYSRTPCSISLASHQQAMLFSEGDADHWSGQQKVSNVPWNPQANFDNCKYAHGKDNKQQHQHHHQPTNASHGGSQQVGGGWGNGQGGQQGWANQGSNAWGNSDPNNGWGNSQPNNAWGGQGNNGWGNSQPNNGWGGNNNGW